MAIFYDKGLSQIFPKNGHARRNWRMVALTQPTEKGAEKAPVTDHILKQIRPKQLKKYLCRT